jgi:nucleotide sugar dehydrogenase
MLRAGADFHVAFAPERTVEGRALEELRTLPQIVGGIDEDSVEATASVFRELTPSIVRVDSLEAAEMVKLINNSYRDLVFAFANQMAQIAAHWNVDIVETIRAANQGYPRDPVPLPSPGVGGPCLTKDPFILASNAVTAGITQPLSAAGRAINTAMLDTVADATIQRLRDSGRDPAKATVLICGVAIKGTPETSDTRNSTSVAIGQRLRSRVATILAHDYVVPPAEIRSLGFTPVELPDAFAQADAVLLLNNHPRYASLDVHAMVGAMRAPAVVVDGWRVLDAADVLQAGAAIYQSLSAWSSSIPMAGSTL